MARGRRSLVQIQPPQPAILNAYKGLLFAISRPFLLNAAKLTEFRAFSVACPGSCPTSTFCAHSESAWPLNAPAGGVGSNGKSGCAGRAAKDLVDCREREIDFVVLIVEVRRHSHASPRPPVDQNVALQ